MRTDNNLLRRVLTVLTLVTLLVWAAWAQDASEGGSCCPSSAVKKTTGACPESGACPVTGACPEMGSGVSGVAIYLDSPSALLAKSKLLSLTPQQQEAIKAIQKKARAQALAVLTNQQKVALGTVPARPVMLAANTLQVCEAGCTKPCCAEATAAPAAQTLCPIMNAPIKKTLFVEYQGKKVYFCCPGCEGAFSKNPQKYLSKLPQFDI